MPLDNTTGYLEQGYANVAAAPLDMQLDQIQLRRTVLANAQSKLRTSNYEEDKRIKSDMRRDDYTEFLGNQDPNLSDEEKMVNEQNYLNNHPGSFNDSQVMGIFDSRAKVAGQIASRGALSNTVRQQKQLSQELDRREETREKRYELENKQITAGLSQATASIKQSHAISALISSKQMDGTASAVSSAFPNHEDEKFKTSAVALTKKLSLSEDPQDMKVVNSLVTTALGMKAGSELSRVYKSSLSRHGEFIDEAEDAFEGFSVLSNFQNPETRKENLEQLSIWIDDEMNDPKTDFDEGTRERFKKFRSSLAKLTSAERTQEKLKKDYVAATSELWELNGSNDPKDQKRMMEITSGLEVTAGKVRAHMDSELENKSRLEAEYQTSLDQKKDLLDLQLKREGADLDQRKFLASKIRDIRLNEYRKAINDNQRWRLISKMDKQGDWDGMDGIDPEASTEEKMIYLDGQSRDTSLGGGGGHSLPSE